MSLHGEFTLADYHFARYLPDNDDEPCVWTLIVSKDGEVVRRETIPLIHRPIFGPDVDDVATCDERVEAIIAELKLE